MSNEREWCEEPLDDAVAREMARIRELFVVSDCDKEDLISYAKEVANLRAQVSA